MIKKFLNLLIVFCLLLPAVSVQAQSGGEPTPPPDGMIYQDGVLVANPLPRQEETATPTPAPVITQGEGQSEGTASTGGAVGPAGMDPQASGALLAPQEAPLPVRASLPSWSGEQLQLEPAEALLSPDNQPELDVEPLGGGDPCKPSHLVTINFDDRTQPQYFSGAVALRNEYRAQGIIFWGDSTLNGGAVLNDGTFSTTISGYSAPNALVFGTSASLPGGAFPRTPETIGIMGQASYVSMKVASPPGYGVGQVVSVNAYDEAFTLLDSDSVVLTAAAQTVVLGHTGITFLTLSTPAISLIVDDISYLPETIAQVIDFDESARPTIFANANPLRNDYGDRGVTFSGPSSLDGGAILNSGAGFSVSGYSAPNFLAFNSGSTLANTGKARAPEEIRFNMPVSLVQIYPASSSPATPLSMLAYDQRGNLVGSSQIILSDKTQQITVTGRHITRVVINTAASLFIIDDLIYRPENAVHADFDDSTQPSVFPDAMPLRGQLSTCGVAFWGGSALDGGAILDQTGGFAVTGYSAPNFLAYNNSAGTMANGGVPQFPQYLVFDPPATYVEFYAARTGTGAQTLYAYAYNRDGTFVAYNSITPTTTLQPVRLASTQPIKAIYIYSAAPVVVIDDLFFTRDNWRLYVPSVQH